MLDNIPEAIEDENATDMEEESAQVGPFNSSLEQFVAYFESTWIGTKSRNKVAPRRHPLCDIEI